MTPASIRNRNSGAQYPGPSARKFGSVSYETLRSKDGIHKIATFPSHVHGAAAHFDLLASRYTGMTLEKAITKWCGSFYASTYIKVLKDRAGIEPSTILTRTMLADHEIAIPLAKAMAWQEAGKEYPMSDDEWLQAHVMAFGGETTAPAWNPRNDVPTPKPETRRAPLVARIKAGVAALFGGTAWVGFQTAAIPPPPAGIKETATNLGGWANLVPMAQWKMLALGAVVFSVVAVVGSITSRVR